MKDPIINPNPEGSYTLGNSTFQLSVGLTPEQVPVISSLNLCSQPDVNWASPAHPLAPLLVIQGTVYTPSQANMRFQRFEVHEYRELRIHYLLANGLAVVQHLQPSTDQALWRSWVTLSNPTASPVEGITRFDALNTRVSVSEADVLCTYLLGWLYGPRVEAPGRPTAPFAYPSWIPGLLYGEGSQPLLFKPEGNWYAPLLRPIVGERLTRLPLRSGKRSTFENFPWAVVLDTGRSAGFFAILQWSGTWRMDLEHHAMERMVSVSASSDGCEHKLGAGEYLVSPEAVFGLFAGDWDDAANVSRRYISRQLLPPIANNMPLASDGIAPTNPAAYESGKFMWREEVDAAAEAGIEQFDIDAGWWAERFQGTDFSFGLGCFTENRGQYRYGLRVVADHVHAKGMKLGLWFEIERVDIRTANLGRYPWRPEWLVHHKGYPHRSWCQHVFSLCLGVKETQEWAINNLTWAVRQYDLDHILIDSNEWAVCDDPSHGHGEKDGEWAQTQGLYRVLTALRQEFPSLLITNLGGGCQRSDPGMARFFQRICPADVICPTAVNRKYSYGIGFLYPVGLSGSCVAECPDEQTGSPLPDASGFMPLEELEWRCLNAMGGGLSMLIRLRSLDGKSRKVIARAVAFFKRIRPTLWGDRYILAQPQPFMEQLDRMTGHREAPVWEAYEHLSRDNNLVALFAYRCLSTEVERTFHLRGLDPLASYRIQSYNGTHSGVRSGADLMTRGIRVRLDHTRKADILLLTRTN